MVGALPAQELLSLREALVASDGELASLRLRSLQTAQRVGTVPAADRKAQHEGEGAVWACLGPWPSGLHQDMELILLRRG